MRWHAVAALIAGVALSTGAMSTSYRVAGMAAEFEAVPEVGAIEACTLRLRSETTDDKSTPRATVELRRSGGTIKTQGLSPAEHADTDAVRLYAALLQGGPILVRSTGSEALHTRKTRFQWSDRCWSGRCNAFAECRAAAVCARKLGYEMPDAAAACEGQPHECRGLADTRFSEAERAMIRGAAIFFGGLPAPEAACVSIAPRPGGDGHLVHITMPPYVAGRRSGTVELDARGKPLQSYFATSPDAAGATDAPASGNRPILDFRPAADYSTALASWSGPADVNGWIARHFEYDRARAMLLSETQRAKHGAKVLEPAQFFESPRGVCVDLSRFAVETLNAIEPAAAARFIMIEFEPVSIGGNTLRLHWLASYRRDGKYFFFADSKRPGHVAGPYESIEAFIADYELYRGRKVVRHRELESVERKTRAKAVRQERSSTTP